MFHITALLKLYASQSSAYILTSPTLTSKEKELQNYSSCLKEHKLYYYTRSRRKDGGQEGFFPVQIKQKFKVLPQHKILP